MKNNVRKFLYVLVIVASRLDILFWKILNIRKKRILIFTDSRGFEITKWRNRKAPWNSYITELKRKFRADIYVCPEKHTTIFDFLDKYNAKLEGRNYFAVIGHLGVVDFSPRKASQAQQVIKFKEQKIKSVFGDNFYDKLIDVDLYNEKYDDEVTASILKESLLNQVAKELNKIPNFIWITCNPVLTNWRGNYKRERPTNINLVNSFSVQMSKYLMSKQIIDLTKWSEDEVQKYTCDNIHLSQPGMIYINERLNNILNESRH